MIFSSQKARKKLFHALSSGQHLWWLHSHSVLQGREVVERCPSPWSWSSELCEGGKARAPVTRSPAESKTMKEFVCNLFHTTTTKISLVQSEFRWFCMLTIYISCKGGVDEKLKLYQSVYQSWPNISADHPCSMQILTCLCTLFHQQSSQRHRNFFHHHRCHFVLKRLDLTNGLAIEFYWILGYKWYHCDGFYIFMWSHQKWEYSFCLSWKWSLPLRCRQTRAWRSPHPCRCPSRWWWGACRAPSSGCPGSRSTPRTGSPCAHPGCSRPSTPK